MTDLGLMDASERYAETVAICDLIAAQAVGRDIMVLAFGESFYVNQPMGEIAASNDKARIGGESRHVAQIVEALRFARSRQDEFETFVLENRQAFDMAELAEQAVA